MATRPATAHSYPVPDEFRPPRPLRTTAFALVPSVVPLALWATGAIPGVAATVAAVVLLGMAAAQAGYVWLDRVRCVRLADGLLLAHPRARFSSQLVDWRAGELTSSRTRRHLARWVHAVVEEAGTPRRLAWTPLNRGAARRNMFLLRRLETRLGDMSRPVSPSGVLVVRELLSDGMTSPLYRSERAEALPDALAEALVGLDVPC
jgi:hypothetical protein